LAECGRAEEVVHQHHQWAPDPVRREERDLVEVFDYDVEALGGQAAAVVGRGGEGERMAAAGAVDPHPVGRIDRLRAGKARAEQAHLVPARRQPAEDLVEVDLGAAGVRVGQVLPVDDEQLHRGPAAASGATRRITASSTPFTKRGLSAVPYFSASCTIS